MDLVICQCNIKSFSKHKPVYTKKLFGLLSPKSFICQWFLIPASLTIKTNVFSFLFSHKNENIFPNLMLIVCFYIWPRKQLDSNFVRFIPCRNQKTRRETFATTSILHSSKQCIRFHFKVHNFLEIIWVTSFHTSFGFNFNNILERSTVEYTNVNFIFPKKKFNFSSIKFFEGLHFSPQYVGCF